MKMKKTKNIIITLLLALCLVFNVTGCGNNGQTALNQPTATPSATPAPTATPKPTPTPTPKKDPEQVKAEAQVVPYEDLARYPDEYEGKTIAVTGEVIQVVEGTTETQYRVKMNDDYNQVVLVGYAGTFPNGRILEDDVLTFYGICLGTMTYKSTMGGNITVPAMMATVYE